MRNHENELGLHEIKGRGSVGELEGGANLIVLVYEVGGGGGGGAGNGAVRSDEENHGSGEKQEESESPRAANRRLKPLPHSCSSSSPPFCSSLSGSPPVVLLLEITHIRVPLRLKIAQKETASKSDAPRAAIFNRVHHLQLKTQNLQLPPDQALDQRSYLHLSSINQSHWIESQIEGPRSFIKRSRPVRRIRASARPSLLTLLATSSPTHLCSFQSPCDTCHFVR
ncbi:hypothetical protein PIB30_060838 [Stylosanthes scabra]|uniref:Uncharacterized protein n=1 Tax=Stylosanthes scabra TaxID=79078 RepID=A0ABU6UJF3_9FABA|nr:hypothetical protein [Stylosanthes scabra]